MILPETLLLRREYKRRSSKKILEILKLFFENIILLIPFLINLRHYSQSRNSRTIRMAKMTTLKIKVIKKNAIINYQMPVVSEKKPKQNTEREIAANVSGWINEFQQRRREDAKQSFNQLFALCS